MSQACAQGERRIGSARASPSLRTSIEPPGANLQRLRRMRRWRVGSLVALHALILAHVAHWLVTGRSLAPVVLSDLMRTLELGEVNPGFVLFCAALATSLLFGRFLCGWACHMGALQDASASLLRRVGVRPRPFRARLLGYAPIALAVYMFIWPTLKRVAVVPAMSRIWPDGAAMLGGARDFPGFHASMLTSDLWAGLPRWVVAVPFLLVCGAATVYFLGTRGLCRYGCPYGGLFAPADRLSIGRVTVDQSRCDQCGICTAVCSSDIRVHEEVGRFGRVVNSRCEKTMDCLAACPRDALSFAFTTPAILTVSAGAGAHGVDRRDLTLGEELACVGVFLVAFASFRGLYGSVPMLMAFSGAMCVAFIVWKAWRLSRDRSATLAGAALRTAGRLTGRGRAFVACAVALGLFVLHSGAVRASACIGGLEDGRVRTARHVVFSGAAPTPQDAAAARRALRWYGVASSISEGGIGLSGTPAVEIRKAWLRLVLGDADRAAAALRRAIALDGGSDGACAELGRVLLLAGRPEEAIVGLRDHCDRDARLHQTRELLAGLLVGAGRSEEAAALHEEALVRRPKDPGALVSAAVGRLAVGRPGDSLALFEAALRAAPEDGRSRRGYAVALGRVGRVDDAIAAIEAGLRLPRSDQAGLLRTGAEILITAQRETEARAMVERVARLSNEKRQHAHPAEQRR